MMAIFPGQTNTDHELGPWASSMQGSQGSDSGVRLFADHAAAITVAHVNTGWKAFLHRGDAVFPDLLARIPTVAAVVAFDQAVTGWWLAGVCAGAVLLEIFFWINVGLPRAVRKGSEEFKRAYYGTEWHP